MQISRFAVIGALVLCAWEVSAEDQTKTFPGAEIIIPAVIGQVAPAIIGAIIGGISGGGGSGGGIGGILPPVPPISASHTTAVATTIADKPIAVSHSGSISTSSGTNSASHASVGPGSLVSSASSTGTNVLQSISKRWQKFFKNIG